MPADVLEGKTFSNTDSVGITGTMEDNGAITLVPGTYDLPIPQGYHNGSGTVTGDANLLPGNIKSGVTLFNVDGDSNVVDTITGDATAKDIRQGKKAWVAGNEITGTMATQNLDPLSTNVAPGYYSQTDLVAVDEELTADNIRNGKTIFGVAGTVGLAWGCTPGSGTWEQGKCQTDCEVVLQGAYDYICPDICLNINNAFEGFVANTGVVVHKNWFCGKLHNQGF